MRKRIRIKGPKVHDVGYRLFLLEEADRIGLKGFDARNLIEDGMQVIEVLAEGEAQRVNSFLDFVRSSRPEDTQVTEVVVGDFEGEVRSIESFYRFFSTSQLSKIVTIGVSMLKEKREMRTEMRQGFKTLGEKIDAGFNELRTEMRQGFKTLGEKIDAGFNESVSRQDLILEELRNLRKDLRSNIEERLRMLEEDVKLIKERLGIG